ncbi:hypothetical protein CRG98_006961 [Punica granatum]|uniref:Uncharacterized protein n=1 Tax=Punica granatum TaxID=22663 RepID=A0A2I0KVT8_PUNGR|nr:hypothetical protein CRG98_006961 [Punica granatum]
MAVNPLTKSLRSAVTPSSSASSSGPALVKEPAICGAMVGSQAELKRDYREQVGST